MTTLKLGKKPATPDSRDLLLMSYASSLAAPPPSVIRTGIPKSWGMLGNDTVGDCVIAGGLHETMLLMLLGNRTKPSFTKTQAINTYSALTGYVRGDQSTDLGTDPRAAAKYRIAHGFPALASTPHKIAAFVALVAGSATQIKFAIHLFGVAGIGIQFPSSAMDQFNAAQPWSVVPGSPIEGGHYVAAVGYDAKWLYVVTWGKVQKVEWSFIDRYMDEGYAYLSQEMLDDKTGLSREGFALNALSADLSELHSQK